MIVILKPSLKPIRAHHAALSYHRLLLYDLSHQPMSNKKVTTGDDLSTATQQPTSSEVDAEYTRFFIQE